MIEIDDWREERLTCGRCKYFCLIADIFPDQQICPNMDYTKYWHYAPYFVAHCTGEHHPPCMHFKPASYAKRLCEQYTTIEDYIDYNEYMRKKTRDHSYLGLTGKATFFKAGDRKSAAYKIRYIDFYYGTYLNLDGELKCVEKMYYVKDRKSPIGLRLEHEWIGKDEYTIYPERGWVLWENSLKNKDC